MSPETVVVMIFSQWWKSRHSILDSNSLDETDEISGGKLFKIRYLGCTSLNENDSLDFKQNADVLLSDLPSANVKKLPTLELLIDSYSVSLKDLDLAANQLLFEVPLSHVRDAWIHKSDSCYSRICFFAARHVPESLFLKAHALDCGTSKVAEELFGTFQSAFQVCSQNTTDTFPQVQKPVYDNPNYPMEMRETREYIPNGLCVSTMSDLNGNTLY